MNEKQNEKKSGDRVNTATKLINRVIRYMLHYYKYPFLLVIVCILITAIATVVGATFPQTLVDDYITPMLQNGTDDFSGLASDLIRLACIMGVGVITAFAYNRIMVNVSQGTMRHLRDDLFRRMESLPIKYFDTHAHGDIMSVYTNDVDTLRQLLSQSIPQIINSVITMAATLVTMIILNPVLTIISILTAVVMLLVTSNFSKLSGRYYIRQQIDLGAVDGFIEEMLDGQKVVKVFCHEEAAMKDFHEVNEKLRNSTNKANRYANLLMPINANIGWISYALVAIVGGRAAFAGGEYECDLTQLYKGSVLTGESSVRTADGTEIDLGGTEVTVEVPVKAVSMSDEQLDYRADGNIISFIYKGNHYNYTVRTATEDEFVLDEDDLWNEGDHVSLMIPKDQIILKRK